MLHGVILVVEPHLLEFIVGDVSKSQMILMVICVDIWCDEIDCFDVIKFTNVVIGEMCY
jgi:hypothetical protein